MLKSKLLELIPNCENSVVGFKHYEFRMEHITKEISSFASRNGGKLLFGIEDCLKTIHVYKGTNNEPHEFIKTADDPINDPNTLVDDPRKAVFDTPNDPKVDILTLKTGHPSITYSEIAISINISPEMVNRNLQELKSIGVVSRRGGRWIVL